MLFGLTHAIYCARLHFCNLPPYGEREKNILIMHVGFADGRNRTQAASESESSFSYLAVRKNAALGKGSDGNGQES